MKAKKVISKVLAAALASAMLLSCVYAASPDRTMSSAAQSNGNFSASATTNGKKPKYVFLFIGDGMSYPQFQAASDYLGAVADTDNDDILDGNVPLSFMNFPVAGSAVTYDSTSFCPDSASTATSISTGHKTYSGTINMDETMTVKYETIAEQLRDEGYDIGVITSVNLNHATPAAFYCHQASRNNYYEIGQEMVASDFDYFAGGALLDPEGENGDQASVYDLAEDAGYKVVTTQAEAEKVSAEDEKVVIVGETLADSDSLSYENDRANGEWALSDYVSKGIEVLEDNDKGFFMMVEGGKIDWACHANDAAASIHDVLEMSNAVQAAVEFQNKHPNDTLILVTADHETGGMAIGYKTTNYDTFLTNLTHQKMSYAKFDSTYVQNYIANKTPFEAAMQDVKANFGLTLPSDPDAASAGKLLLTDYEVQNLRTAYERTLKVGSASQKDMSQQDYELYGTYIPFSMAICHTINHKSGMDHTTYAHTGAMVNVYANGVGAEKFGGVFDNTEIFHKLADLTKVK